MKPITAFRMTIRLDADLYDRLKSTADREKRTLNGQIRFALDSALPAVRRDGKQEIKG